MLTLFRWLALVVVLTAFARSAPAVELKVMTYNLRYAAPRGENSWPVRRPVAHEMLVAEAPDLIGTQEGLYDQLRDLEADLSDYAWIGLGREGGSRGEFMAAFYRRARFSPIAFDHYWLSDTPEQIGSATWGNNVRRMVTWVLFREAESGREFYFVNTHFDHESQPSRERSAELVLERCAKFPTARPVILVGDFNSAAGANPAYDTLVGEGRFADTWTTAEKRGPQLGTFHNYHGPREGGHRIDWILTRGDVACQETHVVTFAKEGQYPSDHFPVIATLRLP